MRSPYSISCYGVVKNAAEAENLCQETFFRMVRAKKELVAFLLLAGLSVELRRASGSFYAKIRSYHNRQRFQARISWGVL
jgi:hypothetical protein